MSLKKYHHFSQEYGIDVPESDLDFFDVNLVFDSKLFVDPFLLKRSSVEEERKLYKRFGIYFEKVLERTVKVLAGAEPRSFVYNFLKFPEPKEVCLGYSETSTDGAGLGGVFASAMTDFFLTGVAGKLISDKSLFEKGIFNPNIFAIFADKVAEDGISDLTINLIADYLIKYTQEQCKKYNVPLKSLPINEAFDFTEMEWTSGYYQDLPENLLKPGTPIILVPKRLLRSGILTSTEVKSKAIGLLRTDGMLKEKFSSLISKPIKDININEIRSILKNDAALLKLFIHRLEFDRKEAYNFISDPLAFLAIKKYANQLKGFVFPGQPKSCDDLMELTEKLIALFKENYERRDQWKDAWVQSKNLVWTPAQEVAWGRVFRAMGIAFFNHFPNVTFDPEVGTGNGFCDFKITYLECKVLIELKKLSNPSYIHGLKIQLPEYTVLSRGTHAIYITGQHRYSNRGYSPGENLSDHSSRKRDIQALVPDVEKELKQQLPKFKKLKYYNIDLAFKASASKM